MDNLDDLIVVIAPVEEEKERGGVRTKRAGGFGHTQMDGGRKPVIVLFALNPEDPQKYAKDRLSGTKRTFVHEFTHYLDSIRGAKGDAAKMADAGDMSGYYLNPTEFNAHFQEVAEGIWSLLNAPGLNPQALAKVRNHYLGKGFEGFYEQFKRDMPNDYQAPFSKYRNKVARRVYKLYTEIVSRLEQEEPKTEGMDNNFFLSKSDVSSAEYPLPDDATKYRNINSKKRGAKKPKVRTDPNSFERIA